jgi:hypothetical protein|tara:strand:+ start:424 stop:1227 length:804 start_codon:yes stop_codon:yes gene_type:complete
MKKILLCDGDSWTAGDIVDPELFGDNLSEVNHPDNAQYRYPRVWPHKLGKLLDVDVINSSISGSSNDAIVRRAVGDVIDLLKAYQPNEIYVIIGWTSPERRDFYYRGYWDDSFIESWETLYPSQPDMKWPSKELTTFFKTYVKWFAHQEEYISRYVDQNLYLHYFLESHNIEHLFFDAFYEKGVGGIESSPDLTEELINIDTNSIKHFLKIRKDFFKDKTFKRILLDESDKFKDELWGDDYHPTELGHKLWAKELYIDLNEKIGNNI